jgi:hypothetical protein
MTVLKLVPPEPKYYLITLKAGGKVKVAAKSYCDTAYGTFAFYREDIELVNKQFNKGCPLTPIYELSRKVIASVEEEGVAEFHPMPSIKKKKTAKPKRKSPKTT